MSIWPVLSVGRLRIYFSKVAKGNNGESSPWRGYCWGSDWPKAQFAKTPADYMLDLSWLCYFATIYWRRWSHD